MKMDTPFPAVRLIDLQKRYGDFAAVDGASLDVRKGEFLTFLGSSGSGKTTTTLNMIAGFDDRRAVRSCSTAVPLPACHRRNATSAWCSAVYTGTFEWQGEPL